MKYLSIAVISALLALIGTSKVSAAPTVELYLGSTITDTPPLMPLEYSKDFTETYFSPSLLNSILSTTLTSVHPFQPPTATGDITVDVYLADTNIPNSKTLVGPPLTLSEDLTTTTSTTSTTSTANYPTEFFAGPTGTFNELIVDVFGSNIVDGGLSFTGLVELESVPEPSTWAMLIGGMGVLLVGMRFRRIARQS